MTSIGSSAFQDCTSLTSVTIPNSVTSIGYEAFGSIKFENIISLIEKPFDISDDAFSLDARNNSTLYVPVGTIDKYKATKGWKEFLFIEEGNGPKGGGDTPEKKKCATPTIGYQNGKLTFNCETEGATCNYTITDDDIKSGSSNEVKLGVTYNISVYATKSGFDNSETAKATLCWIDVEPKKEGVTGVANVRASAVLIQSNDGFLTITGADEGTPINIYNTAGQLVGSAKASAQTTHIGTTLRNGEIGIVKIGEKAVKVLMK